MTNHHSLETMLSSAVYDLYSLFQYPWFCLNYFFAIWLVSALFRAGLLHVKAFDINKTFHDLAEDKKRKVLTYVLQLLMTTMMFVIQIYGSWDILFRFEDSTSQDRLNWMFFALQSGIALYLWELIYRESIGVPLLLVHHLVTLLISQLIVAAFFDTQDIIYIRFGMLFAFHATTEQMSFVALFCYRLNTFPKWHGFLFYAAAVESSSGVVGGTFIHGSTRRGSTRRQAVTPVDSLDVLEKGEIQEDDKLVSESKPESEQYIDGHADKKPAKRESI